LGRNLPDTESRLVASLFEWGKNQGSRKEKPDLLKVQIVRAWGAALLRPYMNLPRRSNCANAWK
jgi:hypothetical protein